MNSDSESGSRSISVRHGRSLALQQNSLVTRGLLDIAQFGNRARAKELVNLGNTCYHKREYGQAIEYYTEAIRLDPNDAIAHRSRGVAYTETGDYDRAIADYSEAIRLDPEYADAYHNRGVAYRKIGDYDRAIADYSEAIRLDPKDATAYHNRGRAHFEKGHRAKAESDFAEAKRLEYKP